MVHYFVHIVCKELNTRLLVSFVFALWDFCMLVRCVCGMHFSVLGRVSLSGQFFRLPFPSGHFSPYGSRISRYSSSPLQCSFFPAPNIFLTALNNRNGAFGVFSPLLEVI